MFVRGQSATHCDAGADVSMHGGVPKQFYNLRDVEFDEWQIPPWELTIFEDRLIGRGSFAKGYLAKWPETEVVAKVVDEEFIRQKKHVVLREFDIMTKLHHPNIVQFLGYVNDPFIIVLEHVPGGDLSKSMGRLSMSAKKSIARDVLKGLIYIHNRRPHNLIHRDIKPSNVLLTRSKVAKIADFGLSKFINLRTVDSVPDMVALSSHSEGGGENLTLTDNVGTRRYMSPEMQAREKYDNLTDMYSCGVLFYELFEGKQYSPNGGMRWFWCPRRLRKLIGERMLCHRTSRLSALCIWSHFNTIMP